MDVTIENYYYGTSGLLLPVPNKSHYPEEFQDKSRLCYYSSLTNSIEINSSFYKIPLPTTVKKWASDVPEEFRFTFKLFRDITHNKDLAFDSNTLVRFFEVIAGVGEKKGCVLVQFPPSVRIGHYLQLQLLMSFLRDINSVWGWRIAVEFRHPSLYTEDVYELLETYQFGMVIHDKFPANSPVKESHPDFIYLRFYGPGGNYRGSYEDDVLSEYASYITEWLHDGKKVFVYFNNTMGEAHANLNMLRQFVSNTYSKLEN